MEKPRMSFPMGMAVLAAVLWLTVGLAAADSLLIDSSGALVLDPAATASAPALAVNSAGFAGLRVTAETQGLELRSFENKIGQFLELSWPDAAVYGDVGAPALPVIRSLFIAPAGAALVWSAEVGPGVTIDSATLGRPILVKPVQPPVEKLPGALQEAVFQMNAVVYKTDADVSAGRVSVKELGIVRGQRLCLLEIRPVGYNPVKQTLTIYPHIVADVRFQRGGLPPDPLSPLPGLSSVVLNPEVLPFEATRGTGNYLIVVASAYQSAIASFANTKATQGFTVSTWVPPTPTTTAIKSYIQSLWGTANAPAYILLVGDSDTIPNWVGQGADSPATDIQYACMDGTSDWYPDIAIGRFPVRSTAQLQAIVDKTLYYEGGAWADPEYVKRAVFMASEDNYQISEGTHNWVIQNYMVPNEIASDKLYCHTYGATTAQVSAAFNNGRFYGIYSGHGSVDSWADGPPFSQSNVNALTNANMYAFVCSFSCLTGQFTATECFMETWVRAPNKAAAAAWGSSVTSYWTEDDILEKKLFDAIYDANQTSVAKELGPVINETKMRYLAYFGPGGSTRRYFEMYNLMGDPALGFPGNCSDAGTVVLDRPKYACESTATIRVLDCGLNLNPNVIDTAAVNVASTSEPAGESVLLTETNPNSALFIGSINLSTTNAPGVLLVAPGDMVTVTYIDADNGQGEQVTVTATATVDCTGPVISNVHATNIQPRSATIAFRTDEPARGTVHYGLSCEALNQTANGSGYSTTPTVDLTGLLDNHTYYYKVDAVDEADNLTTDTTCYSFVTPEVPDYFTQLFSGDNDLRNVGLKFTPNGSVDFYQGCAEPITALPTDPTGGTPLSLTDDSYAQVNLGGGATVALYGASYTTLYVGSNGYLTFSSGDSSYNESLAAHFNQPRISALFDDLNPASGGTVSWKQLADRMAVTWLNVTEYGAGNQNTFQIEMFFDGRLTINYLAVAATDGLAGLSRGGGTPPDFLASDLSALGSCAGHPPTASNASVNTPMNTPLTINLSATDDGQPDPPGALTYIIATLPAHGDLADPGAGAITAVPYTLVGGGHAVVYHPDVYYQGADSFQFKANDGGVPPEGGDSNLATIAIMVGAPQRMYYFPLDSGPGWTTQGQWAFGQPTGGGTHNYDPTSGHSGQNVYGYNLSGDYANNMPAASYLTSTALDCSNASNVELRFWRWLGVESATFDHADVAVSNNGTSWTTVWSNPSTGPISDSAWTPQTFNIAAVADHQATVYLRWGLGPTDASVTYPGWNIDDLEIWGLVSMIGMPGDMNCDGIVNFADINPFVLALGGQADYEVAYPNCRWLNGDCNGDGTVNFADINAFVALLTSG